jgi:phosphate starvation-inducible protein PhoH
MESSENSNVVTNNSFGEFEIKRKFKLTEKQVELCKSILSPEVTCCLVQGYAGTGKTAVAVYAALQLLKSGAVEEIIYVRSPVPTMHEDIGFLAGSIQEKMQPYNEVLFDKLKEFVSLETYQNLFNEGRIKTMPTTYMRGYDLRNSVVIFDECQCTSFNTIYTLMTRISKGSKVIFISDPSQKDIPDSKSGSERMMKIFDDNDSRENGVRCFYFDQKDDIMRSEFVKFVITKVTDMSRYFSK